MVGAAGVRLPLVDRRLESWGPRARNSARSLPLDQLQMQGRQKKQGGPQNGTLLLHWLKSSFRKRLPENTQQAKEPLHEFHEADGGSSGLEQTGKSTARGSAQKHAHLKSSGQNSAA